MKLLDLFPDVVNMSITASVTIGFVLLARLGLKKVPRVFSYVLWSVVLFRAMCPVSFTADFSLLRLADVPVVEVGEAASVMEFISGDVFYPGEELREIPDFAAQETPVQEPIPVLPVLWLSGVGVMAAWGLWSLMGLKKRLREAASVEGNVWECDGLDTAFVLGLVKPRIYLPSDLRKRDRSFMLLHEKEHMKRLDHVWKLAAYGALCVHWFNPLMWLAFWLAQRDMEVSCDEAVLKRLDQDCRCDYSQTLLHFSSGRRWTAAMPLAFGEGNVKERVKHVLNWKKPRMWVSMVCGMVCVALLVACGGNPAVEITEPEETPGREETRTQEDLERKKADYEQEKAELEAQIRLRQEEMERISSVDVEIAKSTYTVDVELTDYANIRLDLPQGWIYENVEPELETSARGIRFWPTEFPDVQIELCWHPTGFGVCGTGLTETELELDNGGTAALGFYDGSDCMSFCAYGMNYAAVNVSTVDKWEEYGDTILGILKSVELNRGVISEEDALAKLQAEGRIQHGWKHYRSEFDGCEGVWTFRFYEDDSNDAVQVLCVDHQGYCWKHWEISHDEGHHSGHHHDW